MSPSPSSLLRQEAPNSSLEPVVALVEVGGSKPAPERGLCERDFGVYFYLGLLVVVAWRATLDDAYSELRAEFTQNRFSMQGEELGSAVLAGVLKKNAFASGMRVEEFSNVIHDIVHNDPAVGLGVVSRDLRAGN